MKNVKSIRRGSGFSPTQVKSLWFIAVSMVLTSKLVGAGFYGVPSPNISIDIVSG